MDQEDRQQPDLDRQDQRVRDERVGVLVEDVLSGENQRVACQVQQHVDEQGDAGQPHQQLGADR